MTQNLRLIFIMCMLFGKNQGNAADISRESERAKQFRQADDCVPQNVYVLYVVVSCLIFSSFITFVAMHFIHTFDSIKISMQSYYVIRTHLLRYLFQLEAFKLMCVIQKRRRFISHSILYVLFGLTAVEKKKKIQIESSHKWVVVAVVVVS